MTVEEVRKALENCAPGAKVFLYFKHFDRWQDVQKVTSVDGEMVAIEG